MLQQAPPRSNAPLFFFLFLFFKSFLFFAWILLATLYANHLRTLRRHANTKFTFRSHTARASARGGPLPCHWQKRNLCPGCAVCASTWQKCLCFSFSWWRRVESFPQHRPAEMYIIPFARALHDERCFVNRREGATASFLYSVNKPTRATARHGKNQPRLDLAYFSSPFSFETPSSSSSVISRVIQRRQ